MQMAEIKRKKARDRQREMIESNILETIERKMYI